MHYTNAATLLSPDYSFDAEQGVFAGYDPATKKYDLLPHAWDYVMEVDAEGRPMPAQDGPDAAGPQLRVPGAQAPLRPLHAGDGGRGLRLPAARMS